MQQDRRSVLRQLAAGGAALLTLPLQSASAANAATSGGAKPSTIRIGVAQPGIGNPPVFSGSSAAVAHAKGWVEEEFKADGIKVELK